MCWILSLHMSAPGGLFSKEGTDGAVGVCLREFQELGRANMLDRHALQFLLQGEPARPSLLPERQEAPAPGLTTNTCPLRRLLNSSSTGRPAQSAESRGAAQVGRELSMSVKASGLTLR